MSTLERTCADCGTRASCPLHAAGVNACGLYVTVAEEVDSLRSELDERTAECEELRAQILADSNPYDMDLVETLRARIAALEAQLRKRDEKLGKALCFATDLKARAETAESALTTARIDGARAFAEWCDQFEAQGVCYEVKDQLARWLASESKEG